MSPDSLRILGLTPAESPDPALVAALNRSGATGVLDLGRDADAAAVALRALAGRGPFGVRLPQGVTVDLPESVHLVVLDGAWRAFPGRQVLVQVVDAHEARAALEAGADGLIAKGNEAGGRVGEESTFVLLQRLLALTDKPVWAQGGIGVHTAAAAVAGGARGVLIDSQLGLVEECTLPDELKQVLATMDGSETTVLHGHRVFSRPDLPLARLAPSLPACLGVGALDQYLLPVGQDGALAAPLARRFPRVRDLVHGLSRAIDGHLGQAVSARPFAADSPFAQQHGLGFPVLQGPMTRVSDVPEFVTAVSDAGGLPFLALSLLRGEKLERLLAETRERLGDAPWGVGMLGFAPPELRREQLRAVRAARPPVALLAGGRPAQAKELEAEGIPTYLHVPSPGLLDLFLKDGARRFVFEGRECGGHVGPRSSFVLWECMVERLLQHDHPEHLSVVFAGGIHDERSAAMVWALSAPLAVRGARIAVLMGTAYLFTEEAVQTGAITQAFQDAALGCEQTVLVHTAPGHATRCVDSDFVRAFEAERQALEASDTPPEARWEALERLNLGRLRIASKGLRRDGDALVKVDDATQRREGMFMIGQVAALRGQTTTARALHVEVSEGAGRRIAAQLKAREAARVQDRPSVDIAIIGMAGFFPDAPDLQAFWSHIVRGHDAITEVPRERWDAERYFDADSQNGEKSASKWGGFLPTIEFDPLEYGIPPRSLAAIEPVQLLALEAARRALADAGYAERPFARDRTSVIFGAEAGTDLAAGYGFRAQFPHYLGDLPPELDAVLPKLTEDSFPGVLANVIAGRIANRLDLGGVNYTVDAACASSLAALDLACKELAAGTSDVVLCGGADLHNTVGDYLLFSSVHALSRTGRSRPFDADADGIALGEGVGVVVCKRLADAERDGDRIYAVVKAVAGSSDGRSLGLTAPRKAGQMRAVERAYERAGVSPSQIGLVEAHGTGTVVGDRTELGTLTEVFTEAGVAAGSVTLGSVKSNVGHTKCAAGLAGLIKASLALHHQVLPPTLHVLRPNPAWNPVVSPFGFRSQASPWPGPGRHAAVSAFGFGGTNFHAVLASYDRPVEQDRGLAEWPSELFLFRDEADLPRLGALLQRQGPWRLRDLAAAVARRGTGPVRIALVADDLEDLREKLVRAQHGREDRGVFRASNKPGKLAFLFPGQGSQRPGMLAELFVAFPELQDTLGDADLRHLIFPTDAFAPPERKEQRRALTDTRVAQPALGVVEAAAARLLAKVGVQADLLGGHSYGEVVALAVGGALDVRDLPAVSRARAQAILDGAQGEMGTMASVDASEEQVLPHLEDLDGVVIANLNSPRQTVLSGTHAGVATASRRLERAGFSPRAIAVACAFHSPLLSGAEPAMAAALRAFTVGVPRQTVFSNTTAEPYPDSAEAVRERLASHLVKPVRFVEQLHAMYDAGARVFVEVGPGRTLTGLVEQTLPEAIALSLEDKRGGGALDGFVWLLAQLAALGVALDVEPLFEGRGVVPVDLEAPPVPSPSVWLVNGQRAWPRVGELPDHAMKVITEPLSIGIGGGDRREKVVMEYLRTLREQAESQRKVLLSYLGEAPEVALDTLPAVVPEAPAAAEPEEALEPAELLLRIVSERTGYPPEMLDLDLDLEADLSIDSIKRIEILGALGERLGSGIQVEPETLVEELAPVKTLRGVLDWLAAQTDHDLEDLVTDEAPLREPEAPDSTLRFVPELEPLDAPELGSLERRRVGLLGSTPLAEALLQGLVAQGARARLLDETSDTDDIDILVDLTPLEHSDQPAELTQRLFVVADRARRSLASGVDRLVVVTGQGGHLGLIANGIGPGAGAGFSGLLKSVAKEWPLARIQRVDLDPHEDSAALANSVLAELFDAFAPAEVGYHGGKRFGRRYVARELGLAGNGFSLSRDSVVLITGGARGITARFAVALAERFGCTLVLVGRSPAPAPEPSETAGARTANDLRQLLIRVESTPAAVEARVRKILADRERRATFEAVRASGARLEYHAVDVRDAEALSGLVRRIYRDHQRLDAVLHGAGVNEDKLLRDKQPESFARVFDTKVAGALVLAEALQDDVGAVVFFSSVAGAFGNRGQSDYAAANDALDQLARVLDSRISGRALSVNWGPWGGGGMVTPELERQYRRRGIGLIDPDEGVQALIDELHTGHDVQVVLMQARPQQMA